MSSGVIVAVHEPGSGRISWPGLGDATPDHPVRDGIGDGPFHAARLRALLDKSTLGDFPARMIACPFCAAPINAACRWGGVRRSTAT